jgi:hypothetical protein
MSEDARSLLSKQREFDIWDILWQLFASTRLTVLLLSILALFLLLSLLPSPVAPGLPDSYAALLQRLTSFDLFNLQLRRLPDTILLRLILGVLALNSLVSVADRLPACWRRLRAPSLAPPESNIGQVILLESVLSTSVEQAADALRGVLEQQGFSYHVAGGPAPPAPPAPSADEGSAGEGESESYTWAADRFPWAWSGSLLFPLGVLLLLLGLALTAHLAWREDGIVLAPGQTHQLQHTALALRLDEVEPGAPHRGYSRLSLLLPGAEEGDESAVRSGSVRPGYTFNAFGLTVFQSDYRPAVRLRVTDSAGSPLALRLFPTSALPSEAPRLSFPEERSQAYFAVPDRALSFRLVFYSSRPSPPEQGDAGPVFLVEVYRADALDPSYSTFAHSGDRVEFGGVRCELTMDYDAALGVTWDPGAWPILPGAILLLLGLSSHIVSPLKLWGSVGPEDGETMVTMFGESLAGGEALRQRLTRIREEIQDGL